MQRLFSLKSASKLADHSTASTSLAHRLFVPLHFKTSLTHQTQTHNFFFHSCQSHSRKIYSGFLSKSLISKHPLGRVSSTTALMDARVRSLGPLFCRQSFRVYPTSDLYSSRWRSWFRRLTTLDMVLGLVLANVAVFMLWRVADHKFMMNNFTLSLDNFKSGRVHTMITSAFSHVDTGHIISNMIGLYFFGMHIGNSLGPEFLLKLYLAGAVGGSVFYLIHQAYKAVSPKGGSMWNGNANTPALGASGAVNAIMLLNILLFPTATLYLDFIIPVPAILLGIFLIGKDMLRVMQGDSRISGSAHLGGAAVGGIAWALVKKGRF